MTILVTAAVVLTIAVAAFVLYPLLRGETTPVDLPRVSEELLRRRDQVYAELRELEFDYRVGKVSAEDYTETRNRLETEAARLLRAIDVQVAAIDDEIEREIREIRARRRLCPSCGGEVPLTARFCPSCGEALKATAKR
ncbi:MAG: zinc ribbon domain-containing protein [Chloroflexi bacterium]|nr:zinc ribbon domain-containing protein [Chloroflexota bacterium]